MTLSVEYFQIRVVMDRLYGQPWRCYHNLAHIQKVKANVQALCSLGEVEAEEPEILDLAIDLHDIVYKPGSALNEEASALLCESFGLPGALDAANLIRLTKRHQPSPDDVDGILICDADLFDLGTDAYQSNLVLVKAEVLAYMELVGIPTDDFKVNWRQGRGEWLEKMMDRPCIFHGPGTESLEKVARENMGNELAKL